MSFSVRRSLSSRVTGEDGGEGGSSNFLLLLLSQTVDRGSDGAIMEGECHHNVGRTGTGEDGGGERGRGQKG